MPRTRISEFSATAADNTDIDSIDIAEGCAPSGINNAIRELMAQLKDFQTGAASDPFNGAVNGTLGATTPAAATITNLAYTGTLTGGTGIINIGSGQIYKDASGNVGIGVTPSAWSSSKALEIGGTALPIIGLNGTGNSGFITQNAYFNGTNWIYKTSSVGANLAALVNGAHQWFTAPSGTAGNAISFTQAMTLDASGNLLVGTTNTDPAVTSASGTRIGSGYISSSANAFPSGAFNRYGSTGTVINISYAGTVRGTIATDGTTVAYNTSSDYRLKENVAPMQNALATVAQLKPCTYTWKADGSAGQGFIAHELQEIVPDCVTGEKDAVDAEGKPQYQGVDTSFLVATVVAALQELKAEFDAYKLSHP